MKLPGTAIVIDDDEDRDDNVMSDSSAPKVLDGGSRSNDFE